MSDTDFKRGVLGWRAPDGSLSDELLWAYVYNRMTRQEIEALLVARNTAENNT